MDDIAEKRIFADRDGATTIIVVTTLGLVTVSIADDRVGEYGLARRCEASDIAAAAGRLAVATDADVLLADEPDVDALTQTGFGRAVAVSFDGDRPVAASPEGRISAYDATGDPGDDGWTSLGEVPAPPAALDGDLVATVDGVFRLGTDTLLPAGLTDVRDVGHVRGIPLAATATGLYELGNGWMSVLDADVHVVTGTSDGRAHAATSDAVYEREDGRWRSIDRFLDGRVVAIAHGNRMFGATIAGDLLVETNTDWRVEPLGLPEVAALAVL